MGMAKIVALQACIMFILMIVGYGIRKKNIITKEGSKQLSEILLVLVIPCLMIRAYHREYIPELAGKLFWSFVFAVIINLLTIAVAKIVFLKKTDDKNTINKYCAAYSNAGFMAIPLLEATMGSEGVFLGASYLAIFNVFNWTHGISLYSKDKKFSIKKILINPGVIGVAVGLAVFFLQIDLPKVIFEPISYLADLNTPLAMMMLGIFLADVDFKKALKNRDVYVVSLVRLVIVPVLAVLIMKQSFVDPIVALAVLIPAACPCATTAALFSARYDLDAGYASEIVAINTLISIVTIPLVVALNSIVPVIF